MRKTTVLVICALLAALPLFGQWHSDTRISNTPNSSYTNWSGGWGIAADDSDVHIVWQDYTYTQRIRYVDFPIGNPPAAGTGTALSTTYGYEPCVASNGTVVQTDWYYSSACYFRERSGSWGSIYSHGYRYPSLATDASGNSYVAFQRSSDSYFQYRPAGGSFGPVRTIYTSGYNRYPSICRESNGTLHVAIGTSNGDRIIHSWSTNNGTSWSSEFVTGVNTANEYEPPSICVDSEGTVHIAYASRNYPSQIYVVSGTTGSWNTPVNVSDDNLSFRNPSICCDPDDNVWVFWNDGQIENFLSEAGEIFYNRYDEGTATWDGTEMLTSDDGYSSILPQVASDDAGGIHVSWYDYRHNNAEIYYNWFTQSLGGRDMMCVSIRQPVGKITNDPIVPKAIIKNNGGDVDSCYANCKITGPGPTYDEGNEEGIIELEPGQEYEVDFPTWTPEGSAGDQYKVEVIVYLWPERSIEDDDPLNNTKTEYATLEGGVEVIATTVVHPELGEDYSSMIPTAYFKNTGDDVALDFFCHCDIVGLSYFAEDYADSVEINDPLDPGDSILIEFDSWVAGDEEPLPYEATFYATGVNSQWTVVPFNSAVGVEETGDLMLEIAGRNPFSSGTLIAYSLPQATETSVKVYDAAGNLVRVLHDGMLEGSGSLYWNGADDEGRSLAGGLYFVRIMSSDISRTAKLIMIK